MFPYSNLLLPSSNNISNLVHHSYVRNKVTVINHFANSLNEMSSGNVGNEAVEPHRAKCWKPSPHAFLRLNYSLRDAAKERIMNSGQVFQKETLNNSMFLTVCPSLGVATCCVARLPFVMVFHVATSSSIIRCSWANLCWRHWVVKL